MCDFAPGKSHHMTFGTKKKIRETHFVYGLESKNRILSKNFIPPQSAAWIFCVSGKKIRAPPPTRRFAGTGALEATGLGHLFCHEVP